MSPPIAEDPEKFAGYWKEHTRRWREPDELERRVKELEAWRAEHEDQHQDQSMSRNIVTKSNNRKDQPCT